MCITVMIAGNIGAGSFNKLSQHRISVVRGCHGNIEDILNAYLKGELVDSSIVCDHLDCDHHAEPGEQFRIAVGGDMK